MEHNKNKCIIVITITILLFVSQNIFAQSEFECGFTGAGQYSPYVSLNDFWGLYKPIRTDISGVIPEPPASAYFPVLVVFVAFADDPGLPQWPEDQAPDYLNSFIAQYKSYNSEWWNAYSETTAPLSDYWLEASRGKMHVLGKAYYVQLGNASDYDSVAKINRAIWDDLKNNQNLTDWRPYDLWKPVVVNGVQKFKWESDGYVDMIYKIHKTRGRGPMPDVAGYAHLTWDRYDNTIIPVDPDNGVSIKYGFSTEGSGLTLSFPSNKNAKLSVLMHEHGHFLFADGHITYGKVVAGPGGEGYLSPYEMILLGYMSPTTITFNNSTPYNLKDYSARDNSAGYILKVPIATGEYFLITNRGNFSKWDKLMLGDTARINSFDVFNELGSGVYIHHVNKEISLPLGNEHVQDLECADGLWSFEYDTQVRMYAWDAGYCFNNGMWNVYKRNQVIYDNDLGMNNTNSVGDDKSSGYYMWAWKGHVPQDPCDLGTERLYTNDRNYYAFDQVSGDRFDPWKMEYNEVFSPYSSPNTNTWTTIPSNQNSGIFIVLRGKENDKSYNIDILKVDATHTLTQILEETPPSRPMGIKKTHVEDLYLEGIYHPKITWNHNMEPDMERDNGKKKYIVYRALSDNMWTLPGPYYVRAVIEIDANSPAEYIDYQIIDENSILNSQEGYEPYPLRYRVVAVDKHEDSSVPSDFADAIGLKPEGSSIDPGNGDKLISNNGLPKEYNLFQNYPNPFNPVTNIQFIIPKSGLVSLKVYDVLGREVKNIVNEFKQAGSYIVSFDGSELSSGIYFYRLESGDFVQVKRMVLIK